MTIKDAIKNFLNILKTPADQKEIVSNVKIYSKAKKPKQSINAALQKLWRKGEIEKYYLKDDEPIPYPTKKGVYVNKNYPRLYSDILPIEDKEYLRVDLSDVVYCGIGQVRKEKHGVSIITYVNPEDYQDVNFQTEVEDHLKDMLLNYLQVNFPDCYYAGSDNYVNKNSSLKTDKLEGYSLDNYQLERNPAFLYPETNVVED